MRDSQQATEINEGYEKGVQFNMGKSYGLTNSYGEITRQRSSLHQLTNLSIQQQKKMMEDYLTQCNAIRKEMNSLEEARKEFFKKMLEKTTDLMRIYKKNLDNEPNDNERLKEKANQLYKTVEDRFMQDWDHVTELNNKLEKLLVGAEVKLNNAQHNLHEIQTTFTRKLETMHIDLTEMENGYWYGNAIRIALKK